MTTARPTQLINSSSSGDHKGRHEVTFYDIVGKLSRGSVAPKSGKGHTLRHKATSRYCHYESSVAAANYHLTSPERHLSEHRQADGGNILYRIPKQNLSYTHAYDVSVEHLASRLAHDEDVTRMIA